MSRRARILLRTGVALIAALVLTLGSVFYLLKKAPDWFKPIHLSQQQKQELYNSVNNKLGNLASAVNNAVVNDSNATFKLVLHENELYAYYDKYAEVNDSVRLVGEKIKEMQFRFRDDQLVIAGQVPGIDSIVSVYFGLTKDDSGQPKFKLCGMFGGSLPLPDALISGPKEAALRAVDSEINRSRATCNVDNPDAKTISVLTGINLIDMMNNKPVDSIVILHNGLTAGFVYARVIDLKTKDGEATLTFRLATKEEIEKTKVRIRRG